MAVFRVDKSNNYTVMSNYHLRDKGLSLKGKGLLSFMLSLPEEWDYSLNGLAKVLKEGETAINNVLDELKEKHYLKIAKERSPKGTFEYIYNIYETPIQPGGQKPGVDNPVLVKPEVDNQTQINTKGINTNNNILSEEELASNFDKIWQLYPRKDGKNTAFGHYKAWLKGKKYAGRTIKLTNKQMWFATKKYADLTKEDKTEKQYIKMGSTFFNEAIMEFVEE